MRSVSPADEAGSTDSLVADKLGSDTEGIRIARRGWKASVHRPDRFRAHERRAGLQAAAARGRAPTCWTARSAAQPGWNVVGDAPSSCATASARPRAHEGGLDCRGRDPEGRRLDIQVTRPERELWARLARDGKAERQADEAQLLDAMTVAIQNKQHIDGRGAFVLALDATDCPNFSLRMVVTAFREQYDAAAVGYREFWVVGPSVTSFNSSMSPRLRWRPHRRVWSPATTGVLG